MQKEYMLKNIYNILTGLGERKLRIIYQFIAHLAR